MRSDDNNNKIESIKLSKLNLGILMEETKIKWVSWSTTICYRYVEEKIKRLRSFSFDKIDRISDNNNKIDNIRLSKIDL